MRFSPASSSPRPGGVREIHTASKSSTLLGVEQRAERLVAAHPRGPRRQRSLETRRRRSLDDEACERSQTPTSCKMEGRLRRKGRGALRGGADRPRNRKCACSTSSQQRDGGRKGEEEERGGEKAPVVTASATAARSGPGCTRRSSRSSSRRASALVGKQVVAEPHGAVDGEAGAFLRVKVGPGHLAYRRVLHRPVRVAVPVEAAGAERARAPAPGEVAAVDGLQLSLLFWASVLRAPPRPCGVRSPGSPR